MKIKPFRFYLSKEKHFYVAIKNIFGFYPENIFLYKLAFRHKSQAEELLNGIRVSNERLEFLGDTVLSTVVADYLFRMFPYKDEGFLTEMRSKIVSRTQLNKLSLRLGIDQLIIHTQEKNNVYRSIKGDAFEAIIGAMYLDKGYTFTRKILINRVIKNNFDLNELINTDLNFKSKLIEWAQKEKKSIEFNVVQEVGSGYHKQYVVDVVVNGDVAGNGRDFSIKGAEQNAAMKAIESLGLNGIARPENQQ
ncbi:MAG: ribonuclease III [Bacteroidales bacterium]|nr:ribonuclease III [Bacteroidales bacterium]MBK9356248.1 ribonuclease III [Bacteroidales bacterium]